MGAGGVIAFINELAQRVAHPLRVTWVDRAYVVAMLSAWASLIVLGLVATIECLVY
jgi:hypothetical protein